MCIHTLSIFKAQNICVSIHIFENIMSQKWYLFTTSQLKTQQTLTHFTKQWTHVNSYDKCMTTHLAHKCVNIASVVPLVRALYFVNFLNWLLSLLWSNKTSSVNTSVSEYTLALGDDCAANMTYRHVAPFGGPAWIALDRTMRRSPMFQPK